MLVLVRVGVGVKDDVVGGGVATTTGGTGAGSRVAVGYEEEGTGTGGDWKGRHVSGGR